MRRPVVLLEGLLGRLSAADNENPPCIEIAHSDIIVIKILFGHSAATLERLPLVPPLLRLFFPPPEDLLCTTRLTLT